MPLQERFRRGAESGPESAEVIEGAPGGQAVAPELARDGVRIGQQAVADGYGALQPSQQLLRSRRVRAAGVDFNDVVVLEKVGDEVGAVGGDADIPLAGLALAFREVSR